MENKPSKSQIHANTLSKYLLVGLMLLLTEFLFAQADPHALSTSSTKAKKDYLSAEIAYGESNTNLAEKYLYSALKKDIKFIEAWLLLGDLYTETNQVYKAIEAYNQAVTIDSLFFPPAMAHLGKLYYEDGQYQKATNCFRSFLSFPNLRPEVVQQIAYLYACSNFSQKAIHEPYNIELQSIGSGVNTENDEYVNSIRLDAMSMLFTRKTKNRLQNGNESYTESFFTSHFQDGEWQVADSVNLGWEKHGNMGALAFSPDGTTLFFAGCGWEDGSGSCDLYVSYFQNANWTTAKNLGNYINSSGWESQPSISSDGNDLYFVSNRKGGKGGSDIWKSIKLSNGKWSKPINLGDEINTEGNEMAPFIHPDNKTLYFSSDKHIGFGKSDLYITRLDDTGRWKQPENLGAPINTPEDEINLLVDFSGQKAYISSKRGENKDGYDVFSFELPLELQPDAISYVKAIVVDAQSKLPLVANYRLVNLNGGQVVNDGITQALDGSMIAALISENEYAFYVQKDGYIFHSENFSLVGYNVSKPFLIQIELQKIEKGSHIVLKNIFFESNKAQLLKESTEELLTVARFLKQQKDIKIELGGYTDNTGSEKWNEQLSLDRAEAVKAFLLGQDINEGRIFVDGFGSKRPIADNDTEVGRAQNRRTELKIIETEPK